MKKEEAELASELFSIQMKHYGASERAISSAMLADAITEAFGTLSMEDFKLFLRTVKAEAWREVTQTRKQLEESSEKLENAIKEAS
ncbi:hypothetical protein FDI69_gp037 [Rhodococcus phage Trina]|uniref:Uncharacterized protein n=1 Tax=Rhodococcus phage Trina TaxID=2027905 RepID=A0A2D1AD92_9CAUD|nr:hypothetical protein FDI69_gp037 [Rhodococcus phage Trina]ASZ74854.1 hypothetical protein SEA_TRINA_37 [Rhodococcus phage Trina]